MLNAEFKRLVEAGEYVSAQFIFNTITDHLINQKRRAASPLGVCSYELDDGETLLMCGAGPFIPNDYVGVDGNILDVIYELEVLEAEPKYLKVLKEHRVLFEDFQELHDRHPVYAWPLGFRYIANKHKLFNKYENFKYDGLGINIATGLVQR